MRWLPPLLLSICTFSISMVFDALISGAVAQELGEAPKAEEDSGGDVPAEGASIEASASETPPSDSVATNEETIDGRADTASAESSTEATTDGVPADTPSMRAEAAVEREQGAEAAVSEDSDDGATTEASATGGDADPFATMPEDEALALPAVVAAPTRARTESEIPQIDVIGRTSRQLAEVPGSAYVVTQEDLREQGAVSANEALRVVPGVHVRDEEGIGLRPNIGFRGLNPDRSRNILVLEDGVPIALAPYGEPELYYAPFIERMERLEIVKGSGSILWGPQTIGGVLNYITKDPPKKLTVGGEVRYGNFGYLLAEGHVGDTVGALGYRLGVVHKRFGGHRGLNLEATDATAKFRFQVSSKSTLGLKLQVYDEVSNATYLGLTRPQYENNAGDNFAVNDRLPVKRYAIAATHNIAFKPNLLTQNTVYASYTERNWLRQDFDRSFDESRNYDRIIDGNGQNILGQGPPYPGDGSATFFRDSTGSRNRAFTIGGIESRTTWDYRMSEQARGELIGGMRFHIEHTSEQRINGSSARALSGALRDDENRQGLAVAGYLQNRFIFWDKFRVSPGLRIESVWNEREIFRSGNEDLVPAALESENVFALIPGLGLSYEVIDQLNLFGGVHRGFAPPRTKDAFGLADGELQNFRLAAEFSWNYELGARVSYADFLFAEVTGFMLDFQNQVIAPSDAGGAIAQDAADLINGGASRHLGVESSVTFDAIQAAGLSFRMPLTLNYTFVDARFGDGWREDWVGNHLPYAPRHMLSSQLRFVHDTGVSAQVNGHYMSGQFTDADNTLELAQNGTLGRIDGRFLLDARVAYTFARLGLTAYVSGKNLTGTQYIASLAPSGIQPGMFRQVFAGIQGEI